MAYLNLSTLSETRFEKAQTLNERLGSTKRYTVFLSYRRIDRQYVAKVVEFLNKLDASIYVDYLDEELQDTPNDKTAPILRKRIEQSKKFVQLITPNSSGSKWMPWELGLGDGVLKYPNAVTLPAITAQSGSFDQEYLKMYGHIEEVYDKSKTKKDWAIFYPVGEAIWFRDWLKK